MISADVVVSGLGGLHLPSHANIEGLADFPGKVFHTAKWDHDHDLTGRRVGIIGTGASAAQVLPGIANDVAAVTVFQRSAAWVLPRMSHDIPEQRRSLFRRHPWLMRLYRWYVSAFMDVFGTLSLRRRGLLAPRLKRICMNHLQASVHDPELRRKLTPDYEPGCKRRCISDDYLTSFNRDNVHLVTDAIIKVEPGGIRDATGTLHEVDTIIEATGFRPFDIAEYVNIRGRDGRLLQDVWQDHIESFRTMMVPGFPNFFMLLGPNSATGHTSALIMIESQTRYVLRCLQYLNRHHQQHVDPDPDVTARYNERLQKDMQRMVFSGGCNAWYTDEHDRNFTLWPYSAARFLLEQSRLRPEEFRNAGPNSMN
jgi:cation diffusion facilitator CzcD-associated flavoprotein CzcO